MNATATTALIIIDAQEGFHHPSFGPRNQPDLEVTLARTLARAREANLRVIHVWHLSRSQDSPLRPGQPGAEIMAEAKPAPGEPVVDKTVHSAFIGTHLGELLVRGRINQIVLAGIATDHCVSTTARMAANYGYDVSVLTDATAAFDRFDDTGARVLASTVHHAALASLRGEFARLVTSDDFFKELGQKAGGEVRRA
jgi:nicotinamidase-related amidase